MLKIAYLSETISSCYNFFHKKFLKYSLYLSKKKVLRMQEIFLSEYAITLHNAY